MPPHKLKDLLTEIEQGRYAVPEIQRPYVWRNSQVKELFEFIYRQYPIGSIIVWEPAREVFGKYEDLFRPLSGELEDKKRNFKYVVIDGQQRLLRAPPCMLLLLLGISSFLCVYHSIGGSQGLGTGSCNLLVRAPACASA